MRKMFYCREIFNIKSIIFLTFLFLYVACDKNKINLVPEDVISDLYLKYKEAITDNYNMSSRRLFKNNRQYEIHVKKLKDVNGFKIHNLVVKEHIRTASDPLIYINNPVESKIPKAYLSLDEFKNILINRVMSQRNELTTKQKTIKIKSNRNIRPKKTMITSDKIKYTKVININHVNITKYDKIKEKSPVKEIIPVLNTIDVKQTINELDTYKMDNKLKYIKVTRNVHHTDIKTTKKESVSDTIAVQTTSEFNTSMIKPTPTIVNTDAIKKEKSFNETKKQLHEICSGKPKLDSDLATTVELSVVDTTTSRNILSVEDYTHNTEEQLAKTTFDNVTKHIYFTTEINNTREITDENITELDEVSIESKGKSNIVLTSAQEKPRRKTTVKLTEVFQQSKKILKQVKRSTLGRPLVFMGNRK
ncbi:uncharacterized protein LOC124537894 [Vanessa cardui]|uniref:uncharacterized protein LOC124537894 n=1 Tax=Vanessa cardui TaxID=171605 RepID=UPI001F13C3AA|nr:uncharacterized protein LOC124537894 [Vanessa cardui]